MAEESYENISGNIRQRMKDLGLTQQQLADILHVQRQTVSTWVRSEEPIVPRADDLPDIAAALKTTVGWLYSGVTVPDWVVKEKMFNEEHMFTLLKTYAKSEHLPQFEKALYYAKKMHAGVYRKRNLYTGNNEEVQAAPYIIHPLMMACQAHALGLKDDVVLTSIMLHDVCEDCGVTPEELPFTPEVQEVVALLTKDPEHKHDEDYDEKYYGALKLNPKAAIVKAIDRCNNVSTMAGSFTTEKLVEYVKETEEYGYPLFNYIKEHYPEYYDAVYIIKYQVMSLIETVKCLQKSAAVRYPEEESE